MTREIGAVVLGLAVAALALREALGLPIGTVRNPGEGFFPLWLAVLLVALSLLAAGGSYLLFAVWLKVPLPPGSWRS